MSTSQHQASCIMINNAGMLDNDNGGSNNGTKQQLGPDTSWAFVLFFSFFFFSPLTTFISYFLYSFPSFFIPIFSLSYSLSSITDSQLYIHSINLLYMFSDSVRRTEGLSVIHKCAVLHSNLLQAWESWSLIKMWPDTKKKESLIRKEGSQIKRVGDWCHYDIWGPSLCVAWTSPTIFFGSWQCLIIYFQWNCSYTKKKIKYIIFTNIILFELWAAHLWLFSILYSIWKSFFEEDQGSLFKNPPSESLGCQGSLVVTALEILVTVVIYKK